MSRNLQLQVVLNAIDKATRPIKAVMDSSSGLGKQLKQTRDQLKGLQAQQKDIESFKKLKDASRTSTKAMSEQQQRVRELAQRMRETENPTKTMTKEFESATRQAKRLKDSHDANAQQMQVLRTKLNEAGISTGKAKDGTEKFGIAERELRKRIDETSKSLDNQKKRLQQVTEQQKRLASAKAQYERTTQLASNLTTAGAGALATGGGALYGGARFMQTGMEFDTSMSKVQSLARLEIDSEQMQALRAQARKLGAETMFSATEAAQGQGFLAMAGFTPQAILDAMPGMLDIAKAGDMDLARTADISSNILTGMNLEAADMGRVGDILVGTFTRSNTSLEMLGDTMKYVAPVAASVGQDIETVAAMAGKLGDAGIQGSMGGTALRSIINRLSSPPAAAAKALDKLGISAKDAQGNMRGMPDILTELYDKTKMMGDADRAAALKEIAGSEAVSAMQVLVKQAGSGELQKFITMLRQSEGEAAETARKMADNLTGDLDEFFSAFDDVKIEVFEGQNSALRDLAAQATATMSAFGAWAKENPELLGTLIKGIAIIAGLVAAGGALMLTIGSILGPLAMMRYALTVLGVKGGALIPVIKGIGAAAMALGKAMLASPLGIFAAAAAAAVVAAVLLIKNWDLVKAFFKGFFSGIAEGFAETSRALANTFSPAAAALKSIVKVVASVIGWLKNLIAPVSSAKESLEGAASAGRFFGKALGSLAALTVAAVAIKAVGTALLFMGKAALANPVFAVIAAIALAAYMIYKNWAPIKEFFASLWRGVSSAMNSAWNEIKEAFSGGVGGISALIINWSPLGLFYKAFAGVMSYFGFEMPGRFTEFGGNIINSFIGGAAAVWSTVAEFFLNRWTDISAAFDGGIAGIGALIVNWSPLGLFYQAFAGVMDYFGVELPGRFTEFGSMIVQGLISGIKNMGGAVKDAVLGMGDSVTGWFKGKLGIQSPSRVFMQLGDDTAEGLALGIAANKDSPLKQVAAMAKQVTAAGAVALSVAALPAAAAHAQPFFAEQSSIRFDDRPPISAQPRGADQPQVAGAIEIHVHAAPGMDELALAQLVQRELEKAQRQQQVRTRSRFGDLD